MICFSCRLLWFDFLNPIDSFIYILCVCVCVCWLNLFISIYYIIVRLFGITINWIDSKMWMVFYYYEIITHVCELLRDNKTTNKKKQSSLPSIVAIYIFKDLVYIYSCNSSKSQFVVKYSYKMPLMAMISSFYLWFLNNTFFIEIQYISIANKSTQIIQFKFIFYIFYFFGLIKMLLVFAGITSYAVCPSWVESFSNWGLKSLNFYCRIKKNLAKYFSYSMCVVFLVNPNSDVIVFCILLLFVKSTNIINIVWHINIW